MSDQLKRIIKLAKKTGDRIVVFDNSEPENSFVLMNLDEYEEMLGSSDGEVTESGFEKPRYQQEIKEKALTEEKIVDTIKSSDKMWQNDKNFQKENIYSSGQVIKNRFKNGNWQIPKDIKEAAEKEDGSSDNNQE